jgi:argininosuccinate lyase
MLRRGRFEGEMEPLAARYTSSLDEDMRIFSAVVQINLAHVIMLADQGIISKSDASKLLGALLKLHEIDPTKLETRPEQEDIHVVVEDFVVKEVGEVGGKLHTAKSRNDQVVTAIKIVLRKELLRVEEALLTLVNTLLERAEENKETVMPGYTHLQVAEPTTFAHYLAAYCSAFLRDVRRLEEAFELLNSCPMGACALAGTSFQIDRGRMANLLGFKRIDENTMDAVGSRDFVLQSMSALAITTVNLSRLAEEIILWSSWEFDMLEVPDEFSSTSSIMPQKKNPVVAEVMRAKSGKVFGNLTGALTLLKALCQSYALDLQELTPLLWSSVDETGNAVEVMTRMMKGVKPKVEVMREKSKSGFSTATELADCLVRSGLSFRDAHAVVGRMVSNAIEAGKTMEQLGFEDFQRASEQVLGKRLDLPLRDFSEALDLVKVVEARSIPGGPSPKAVSIQLKELRRKVKQCSKLSRARWRAIRKAEEKLLKKAKEFSE